VTSCRAWLSAGIASSTSVAAHSKSSAASACSIASDRLPFSSC
jgi:hypothetical protein